MQSSFLRFITMVALLISVICEDAKEEKEEIRETRNEGQNEGSYEDLLNDKIVDIDSVLSDTSWSETNKLAHKFADDAVKSPKMQETINKLVNIGTSPNDLDEVSQFSAREHAVRKSKMRSNRLTPGRHRDRTKKKMKRHKHRHRRKRLKNRRPRWSKKEPAKVDSDSKKKQNIIKEVINVRGSTTNPERKIKKMSRKYVPDGSKFVSNNMTAINWDYLEDYIDSTRSTNSKIEATTIPSRVNEDESMVERLMKTTTRDPKKKSPGDQGMEYSDYYNDLDALEEERKSKEKRKHPRARSVRQSFTVSSPNRNLYVPDDENAEIYQNSRYLDENANDIFNHLPNSVSPESMEMNNGDDEDSFDLQTGNEENVSPNGLEAKRSYDSMMLATGQEQNSRPAKMNERNFVKGVSNSAFSQLGQNERSRPVLVGQENSADTDVNPMILQLNENQYTLPPEIDDKNLYNNNYAFNSGQEREVQRPIEDNLNYLNNYGTLLEKNDKKYIYPIVNNLPYDPINDQSQMLEVNQNSLINTVKENTKDVGAHRSLYELPKYSDRIPTPEITKSEDNTIELKNPTNVYSEPYGKTFVMPPEQQQLRYVPMYKNIDQGNRLLLGNLSEARNEGRDKISLIKNTKEPLKKISDVSSPRQDVQRPVERILTPDSLESEGSWRNENESNNLMTPNQQMIRRGLQREIANFGGSKKLDESSAEKEERLRREFAKRQNRHSVEDDVAKSHRVDIAVTVNETKEVADQILNRIVDELEEIKMDHSKDKNSEGFPCKLAGSWVTSKAGVRIDMKVTNHSIRVTLANLIPQPMHVGFLNTTWNVTGYTPFKRGGPFSLQAYDNRTKTLAVFVGSCRVCQGIDTIEGVWSIASEPRDCRNFQMATEIFNDIFRRTKLLSAIKEKKKAILQSMLMGNLTNATFHGAVKKNGNEENEEKD